MGIESSQISIVFRKMEAQRQGYFTLVSPTAVKFYEIFINICKAILFFRFVFVFPFNPLPLCFFVLYTSLQISPLGFFFCRTVFSAVFFFSFFFVYSLWILLSLKKDDYVVTSCLTFWICALFLQGID